MKNQNGIIARNDLYIILIIVIFAAVTWLPQFFVDKAKCNSIVVSDLKGEIYSISFAEIVENKTLSKTVQCATGSITFEFDAVAGARVAKASCPDKLCVHTGFINTTGQIIACLPGKIYVEIKSDEEAVTDAVLR